MSAGDQRDYSRYPLEVAARIINMEGTSYSVGYTQDVSKGGVCVLSDKPVLLDAVYSVLFAVPHEHGSSNVFALMDPVYSVGMADGTGFQNGFAFRHVGVNHAALILSFITQRQYPEGLHSQGRPRAVPAYMRGMSPVAMLRNWREAHRDD